MPKYKDISGQRFGRLVVAEYAGSDRLGKAIWKCACDCGNDISVRANSLNSGLTVSCGCRRAETLSAGRNKHGLSKYSGYSSWKAMIDRCTNENSKDFKWYGARGIKVCERWFDIENFAADMGARPSRCSIDRIDPNGDYTPENCKWSTPLEQGAHKRNNVVVSLAGVTAHVAEVSRKTGIPETTVRRRAA